MMVSLWVLGQTQSAFVHAAGATRLSSSFCCHLLLATMVEKERCPNCLTRNGYHRRVQRVPSPSKSKGMAISNTYCFLQPSSCHRFLVAHLVGWLAGERNSAGVQSANLF
eukprot:6451782-Amphidinium_carterae.1